MVAVRKEAVFLYSIILLASFAAAELSIEGIGDTFYLELNDVDAASSCTCSATGSSYNATYNNLLNQQCPTGSVVNGTLSNGTFICTSDIPAKMDYRNIAMLNISNNLEGNQTLSTNSRLNIGNVTSTVDQLAIYADSFSAQVVFDDSKMSADGTLQMQPNVNFYDKISVASVTDVYSQFGSGSVSLVTVSDTQDRLIALKEVANLSTAFRVGIFDCEVTGNAQSSSGSCNGVNSFAGVTSGVGFNGTQGTGAGQFRGARNAIILSGVTNVARSSAFVAGATVAANNNLTNYYGYYVEQPTIGGQITNFTGVMIDANNTVTGPVPQVMGMLIKPFGFGTRRYGILQEGASDQNVFNGNVTINNKLNTQCVNSIEYIDYADAATLPSGYLPYNDAGAVTSIFRGYPVRYPMEIRSITISSNGNVTCYGADATTGLNNSCKLMPVFNQSGAYFTPGNITLFREIIKTTNTSINLTTGDSILVYAHGSTLSNASSTGISSAIVQFEAMRRC